jgi:predicted nuclease with TOPRIM domain
MKRILEEKLRFLEAELQNGQKMMNRIEKERNTLHNNMLRISGAIQVLKEALADDGVKIEKEDIAIVAVGK